jgi:imidazole glycerol phosphate synthase glutamine amidotransferase subunit
MKIVIIDYGAGNIQSIQFAIKRLGFEAVLSKNPIEIQQADKVIFPGVGEASSAMKMLVESGLDQLIPTLKQPVLGICLGMQLMCKYSEEGSTNGLGIFDVNVVKFSQEVKVPQTIEEYNKMVLEERIKRIQERNRIAQIKSTKMLYESNNGNMSNSFILVLPPLHNIHEK